jgi:LPS O-antigen subunit length determinant protein (WzzB/FepE family)
MENINTAHILYVLKIHRIKFMIIATAAIIISSFISSPIFIASKFKSTAVVFPVNLQAFSEESSTEQLLQFMNSEEIKNAMTKRFNLYSVFGIDSLEEKSHAKFDKYYYEYFSVSATLYESIVINVINESPSLAQKMANALIDETNKFVRLQKKTINDEYIKSYENQLKIATAEIDSIESQLKSIRTNFGILDFKAQSKIINKKQSKGSLSNDEQLILKGLKEVGGKYIILQSQLKTELTNYTTLKFEYAKSRLNSNSNLNYTTVVSKANLPDKKHSPERAIIVVLFTLSALLLSLFIILFTHKKQNDFAKN